MMSAIFACLILVGLFNLVTPEGSAELIRGKREAQACFCDEELGCFYNNAPWTSMMRPFPCPWDPSKVGTKFKMFSKTSNKAHNITQWPKIEVEGSGYDPSKKTVIAVHGYNGVKYFQWMYDLKDAYLNKQDVNFLVIDWSQGSGTAFREYFQAASNTRTVGAELARLLKHLISSGQAPKNFHCVGHSLGAQVCGYAAKQLKKGDQQIGQISALDPAQPGFEGEGEEVRIHKGDAKFIDVIHSDAVSFIPCLGFGMMKPLGDVDFYLNGGSNQPGCSIAKVFTGLTSLSDIGNIPEDVQKNRACSHKKATEAYVASVENENCMLGKQISSSLMSRMSRLNTIVCVKAIPMTSDVDTCTDDNCVPVGLRTVDTTARGSFLVEAPEYPYCSGTKRSVPDSDSSFWETITTPFKTLIQPLQRLWTW